MLKRGWRVILGWLSVKEEGVLAQLSDKNSGVSIDSL
jgi:hypothetical protein